MDRLEEIMEKKQKLVPKYESTKRIDIDRHDLSNMDEEEEDGGGGGGGGDEGEDRNGIIDVNF